MASFNRVILLGNMTRDPEVRYTPGGTAVCEIGLAVNDRRKGADGEWFDETTFVDVTLWGKTAETCGQYLSKGSPVLIEGRLKLDTWEQEGQKRSKMRVICERMQMVGSRNSGGGAGGGGGGGKATYRDESEAYGGGYDDFGGGGGGSRGGGGGKQQAPPDDIPF